MSDVAERFITLFEDGPCAGLSWEIPHGTTTLVVDAADKSTHLYKGDESGLYLGGQVFNHVREISQAPPRTPVLPWPKGAPACWSCDEQAAVTDIGLCDKCYKRIPND